MGRSTRILGVAAIAVASVFMTIAPAGASSARISARHGSAAAAPNTNLSGKGATAKFTPNKLTGNVYTTKQCNKAKPPVSFTITNATKNSYNITFEGDPAYTQPKNTIFNICISGKPGTVHLGIAGSTHILT